MANRDILTGLKDYLLANNTVKNLVDGNIQTEETDIRTSFPCIFLIEKGGDVQEHIFKGQGGQGFEHDQIFITILTDAEDTEARQTVRTIEQEIYSYLINNDQFSLTNYDRVQLTCLNRGLAEIKMFDEINVAVLPALWQATGWYEVGP